MNTYVNLELAKLLKEKGYSWECENFYKKGSYDKKFYLTTGVEYDSEINCVWDWNLNGGKSGMLSKVIPYPNESNAVYYSAPTIGEVLMWVYEKHGFWISVKERKHTEEKTSFVSYIGSMRVTGRFQTPTEAYETSILYCLKNMIKLKSI
jgi:hypothetical protein